MNRSTFVLSVAIVAFAFIFLFAAIGRKERNVEAVKAVAMKKLEKKTEAKTEDEKQAEAEDEKQKELAKRAEEDPAVKAAKASAAFMRGISKMVIIAIVAVAVFFATGAFGASIGPAAALAIAVAFLAFFWAFLPWWLAAILTVLSPLLGYLIFLALVEANILWTRVESGWVRIILKWGKYHRTIEPGLRWIGIPGIYTLYKRKMTFFKSVTDKDGKPQAEPHNDPDIMQFKTTRYPFASPFKDEEDSHSLHLSGILAWFGVIEDYEIAFFEASDWYAEANTRILSCHRDLLATISYDDDIVGRDLEEEQVLPTLSQRLWKRLNSRRNGNPSILDEIRAVAGMRISSVELRSVDPPEGWRDTTLAPYKAMKEKEAAVHEAEKKKILAGDPLKNAMAEWVRTQVKPGETEADAAERLVASGAYAKQQLYVYNLLLAGDGKLEAAHILYGSPDGSPLPSGLTYLSLGGGGGLGILAGGGKGGKGKIQTGGKRLKERNRDEPL